LKVDLYFLIFIKAVEFNCLYIIDYPLRKLVTSTGYVKTILVILIGWLQWARLIKYPT